MDHLPLPQGAKHRVVPLLSRKAYDGGPFATYPLRTDPPMHHFLSQSIQNFMDTERSNPTPKREIDDFLQTWLFFGMLEEFFGADLPTFWGEDFIFDGGIVCDCCGKFGSGTYYHCNFCDGGDYDLCESCYANGKRCRVETHTLAKRAAPVEDSALLQHQDSPWKRTRQEDEPIHEALELPKLTPSATRSDTYGYDVEGTSPFANAGAVAKQPIRQPQNVDMADEANHPVKFVSTARLNSYTELWISKMKSLTSEARDVRCMHLRDCLKLLKTAWEKAKYVSTEPKLNLMIELSTVALGEHLLTAITRVSNIDVDLKWPYYSMQQEFKAEMIANGWCPHEAEEMRQMHLSTRYYLSKMRFSIPPERHGKCTDQRCLAFQTDADSYVTQHKYKDCACDIFAVDNEKMHAPLLNDSYPLLRIVPTGKDPICDIDIVAASETSLPYVAISHVWADGAGNPHKTALHHCQLDNLYKRINKLARLLQKAENGPLEESTVPNMLVWIDTLCCPVGPKEMKKKGLAKIREVYERAAHVLVLDSSLENYDTEKMDDIETFARISLSPWSRRLWTLQEAALAKLSRLWFQFRDTVCSMSLVASVAFTSKSLNQPSTRNITSDLNPLFHIMTNVTDDSTEIAQMLVDNLVKRNNGKMHWIYNAVGRRSVSEPADEALCLASLLGYDLSKILETDSAENRAQTLNTMIDKTNGGIYAGVVFAPVPRLAIKGFAWAPKSFLSRNSTPLWPSGEKGRISDKGLKVRFPAMQISRRPSVFGGAQFEDRLNDLPIRLSSTAWVVLHIGEPAHTEHLKLPDVLELFYKRPRDVVVIYMREHFRDGSDSGEAEPALIGLRSNVDDDLNVITTVATGFVVKITPESHESAFRCVEDLRRDSAFLDLLKLEDNGYVVSSSEVQVAWTHLVQKVDEGVIEAPRGSDSHFKTPEKNRILRGLLAPYATAEVLYPSTSEWIID